MFTSTYIFQMEKVDSSSLKSDLLKYHEVPVIRAHSCNGLTISRRRLLIRGFRFPDVGKLRGQASCSGYNICQVRRIDNAN